MKSNKRITQILSLTLIAGLLITSILVLAACSQAQETAAPIPNTGEEESVVLAAVQEDLPGNVSLLLMDGTQLEMLPLTNLQVVAEAATPDDKVGTVFTLVDGQVVIVPKSDNAGLFTVQTSGSLKAILQGCGMAVSYSSSEDSFAVYCIGGSCKFTSTNTIAVGPGMYMVYKDNSVAETGAFDAAAFLKTFDMEIPVCAAGLVPVTGGEAETPEPTVDAGATATAACLIFQQQFPSTPCP